MNKTYINLRRRIDDIVKIFLLLIEIDDHKYSQKNIALLYVRI